MDNDYRAEMHRYATSTIRKYRLDELSYVVNGVTFNFKLVDCDLAVKISLNKLVEQYEVRI